MYPKLFQCGLHELCARQRGVIEHKWGSDGDERILGELQSGFGERAQLLQRAVTVCGSRRRHLLLRRLRERSGSPAARSTTRGGLLTNLLTERAQLVEKLGEGARDGRERCGARLRHRTTPATAAPSRADAKFVEFERFAEVGAPVHAVQKLLQPQELDRQIDLLVAQSVRLFEHRLQRLAGHKLLARDHLEHFRTRTIEMFHVFLKE